MNRSTVLIALVLLVLTTTPASAITLNVTSYPDLVAAVNLANEKAKVCTTSPPPGCLGEIVDVLLLEDINLNGSLPAVMFYAYLKITGGCSTRARGRCVIDGMMAYQVFPFTPFGGVGPALLELTNLIFQRANGGVVAGIYGKVNAYGVIFRNNANGVIIGSSQPGGAPPQNYTKCRFVNNNGTAIYAGNAKYGGISFTIKDSLFLNNRGIEANDSYSIHGGAVKLAGSPVSTFENVQFVNNIAVGNGGAIYGDETNLVIKEASFIANQAVNGVGGAVAAISGFYQSFSARFCSCFFTDNTSGKAPSSTLAFEANIRTLNLTFCDTPIPADSILPGPPLGNIVNETLPECKNHC